MNVQTPMPLADPIDASVLTPSERLETLLEMVLSLNALESASAAADAAFQNAVKAKNPAAHYLGDLSGLAIQDECKRGDEIIAHLKTLAGDGTLDQCRDLLILPPSDQ